MLFSLLSSSQNTTENFTRIVVEVFNCENLAVHAVKQTEHYYFSHISDAPSAVLYTPLRRGMFSGLDIRYVGLEMAFSLVMHCV